MVNFKKPVAKLQSKEMRIAQPTTKVTAKMAKKETNRNLGGVILVYSLKPNEKDIIKAVKLHKVFKPDEFNEAMGYANTLKGKVAINYVKF